MKNASALFLVLLQCFVASAQQGASTLFTFGGEDVDEFVEVIATPEDEFLAFGTSSSSGLGADFWLTKFTSSMDCVWSNTYYPLAINQAERATDIVADGLGNYYLIGWGSNGSENGYDVLVYKIDGDGNPLWHQYYGGSDWDFANAGAMVNDQLVLVGESYSNSEGGKDGAVWIVSDAGILISQWNWGAADDEDFVDVLTDGMGQLIVAGNKTHATGQETAHLIAYTPSGEELWSISKEDVDIQHNAMSLSYDNNEILWVGRKKESVYTPWVLEVQEDGSAEQVDFVTFGGDYYYTSVLRRDELFFAVGNTNAFGLGGFDGVLYQFSSSYGFYSGTTYGGGNNESISSVALSSTGVLVAVGKYQSLQDALAQAMVVHIPMVDTDGYAITTDFDGICFVTNVSEYSQTIDNSEPVDALVFTATGQRVMHYQGSWNPSMVREWNLAAGLYVAVIRQGKSVSRIRFFQP